MYFRKCNYLKSFLNVLSFWVHAYFFTKNCDRFPKSKSKYLYLGLVVKVFYIELAYCYFNLYKNQFTFILFTLLKAIL